jgi:cytochrome c553
MQKRKVRQADWVAYCIGIMALLMLSSVIAAREADLEAGKEINELCAGCHGEYGQGGKQGVYPRLAGQPYRFLVDQLVLFRERKRPNLAMLEYVDERQMPDEDIQDVSAYLASLTLPTRLPPIDESAPGFDALARLEAAKRVMQIPLAEGDVEVGRKLYRRECASCHGREGRAKPDENVPMLQGQYTAYLRLQVGKYLNGLRIHDPNAPQDRLLAEFTAAELDDIFAYVSTLDD